MITSILTAIATNVVLGWLWRRVQEIASWAFGLVPLYLSLPAPYQELIREILAGRGGAASISAYIGFAYYLYTQWQSWRATVQPQVVVGGRKVPILTDEQAKDIEEAATGVRPTEIPRR